MGEGTMPQVDSDAGEVLHAWDSWLCEVCGNRYFTDQGCCGAALAPVTITMTRRGHTASTVDGGA